MEKVLDRMRCLCSRREYCRSDVMKKALKALDGDRDKAEKVVETLVKEKFIDDLRYSSAFARDKASLAGWGQTKIRYMLSAKGISKEVITAALGEIDGEQAADKLERLMANKFKSLKDDPQCRIKMLRFALGRGYDYEEASSVLDKLVRQQDK